MTHVHLSLQTKPVDPTVDGGAQVQQAVNIECVSDFTEAPVLNIQFRWEPRPRHQPLLLDVGVSGWAGTWL